MTHGWVAQEVLRMETEHLGEVRKICPRKMCPIRRSMKGFLNYSWFTPPETNDMTMEKQAFEDVSPYANIISIYTQIIWDPFASLKLNESGRMKVFLNLPLILTHLYIYGQFPTQHGHAFSIWTLRWLFRVMNFFHIFSLGWSSLALSAVGLENTTVEAEEWKLISGQDCKTAKLPAIWIIQMWFVYFISFSICGTGTKRRQPSKSSRQTGHFFIPEKSFPLHIATTWSKGQISQCLHEDEGTTHRLVDGCLVDSVSACEQQNRDKQHVWPIFICQLGE